MFKYSFDFKFKAVKYVVYGKHSYREASRKFNVHQEQIRVWTNRYKTYGKIGYLLNNRNIAIDRVRVNGVKKKKNKQNTNSNALIKSTSKFSLKSDKSNAELLKEIEDLRMEMIPHSPHCFDNIFVLISV